MTAPAARSEPAGCIALNLAIARHAWLAVPTWPRSRAVKSPMWYVRRSNLQLAQKGICIMDFLGNLKEGVQKADRHTKDIIREVQYAASYG